jgi:hypothetical protein
MVHRGSGSVLEGSIATRDSRVTERRHQRGLASDRLELVEIHTDMLDGLRQGSVRSLRLLALLRRVGRLVRSTLDSRAKIRDCQHP